MTWQSFSSLLMVFSSSHIKTNWPWQRANLGMLSRTAIKFIRLNQALYPCQTKLTDGTFFRFYLKFFHMARQSKQIDCLASMKNKRKVFFTRTQRRIVSSGIEPRVSNLSTTNLTIYQPGYRRQSYQVIPEYRPKQILPRQKLPYRCNFSEQLSML